MGRRMAFEPHPEGIWAPGGFGESAVALLVRCVGGRPSARSSMPSATAWVGLAVGGFGAPPQLGQFGTRSV
jgi:hypothetical protein